MIDKQVQDLAWKCLPKEIREHLKCVYKSEYVSDRGYQPTRIMKLLLSLFGHHNLTSDAEPEEMLIVPRNKVQDMYADIINDIRDYNGENPERVGTTDSILRERAAGMKAQLRRLFGAKCLPDEPASVSKPFKYSVGQKVILHFYGGEVSTITEAFNDGSVWNKYKVKMMPYNILNEYELDPYEEPKPDEPKFNVGNIVRFKYCCTPHRIDGFKVLDGVILYLVDEVWAEASDLEPYTEPEEKSKPSNSGELESQATTDCNNMEKKGLNLCEILKGHEGEKFFDSINGECVLITLDEEVTHDIIFARNSDGEHFSYTDPILTFYPSGMASLYPFTRCILHDAKTSWETWIDEQKPWVPKDNEYYWCINDLLNPISKIFDDGDCEDHARVRVHNCFRTKELAQQASEAARECLDKFSKNNQQ